MFEEMNQRIDREIAMFLLKVRIRQDKQNKVQQVKAQAEARKAKSEPVKA
jgi:preprotein translocase subunit SecA